MQVLGRSILGHFQVDATKDPMHLDIQVPGGTALNCYGISYGLHMGLRCLTKVHIWYG